MKALVKANKSGLVKAMKAAEFKEIIAKEISEIENEIKEETDRDTYDFSKRVRVNEIRTLKEKLQMTSESLGRLESLIQRLDSSKENEFVLPPIKQSKANNSETYPS